VAHVGRVLGDGEPKYLNPGEISGVFVKGDLVFGLYEAAEHIRNTGEALITEGQFSAMTPHLHGLRHVVACGGKAFGRSHVRSILGAGGKRATFLMDADPAGREAVEAGLRVALAEGFPVRVAELPVGMDPDDYLRDAPGA
jgi:DNA primase